MENNYDIDLCSKMREIYKLILERIVDDGEILESDILFIRLYKEKFALVKEKIGE